VALLLLALAAALALYLPALTYGLVNYDDTTLVRDNWLVRDPSLASLRTIFFDLDVAHRLVLTPEYLPVRDVSVMLDYAVWGDWYAGFHLTNLVVYLSAIVLWFLAFAELGVDRTLAGVAMLLWAVHPTHVESVAWLAERKGLLAAAFAGAAALAYARFRAGRSNVWLVAACVTAIAAVWSKAHGAFAIAALPGLELLLPARRVSWRRSLVGVAAIGVSALLAFVPVLLLAQDAAVVGTVAAGGSRFTRALGTHGLYVELATMLRANSVSYPITQHGPSALEIAIGAASLVVLLSLALVPQIQREIRAGAAIWLIAWIPISHLILPLQMVVVADRYLLLPTLGLGLALSATILRIGNTRLRIAIVAVLVLAACFRTLEARVSWAGPVVLWQHAVQMNPDDGNAWSMYAESLDDAGASEQAEAVVEEGLLQTNEPRLLLRKGLLLLQRNGGNEGAALVEKAAQAGEYRAMANFALLRLQVGRIDDALMWARRAVATAPLYAAGQRALGKVALAANLPQEALTAFEAAYRLEPQRPENRVNVERTRALLEQRH
jgi:hypothetical protein